MTDSANRRGAANLTPVLMVLSFAAMIGLLVWLGLTSEGTETVAMNPQNDTTESVEMGARAVLPEELEATPENFVDDTVRVTAPVAEGIGSETFFLDFPNAPFLVRMVPGLAAERGSISSGTVVVTGRVVAMTDSIVSDWREAGTIAEADAPLLSFSTHFIEAHRLRNAPSAAPSSGGEEGEGGEGGDAAQEDGGARP